MKEQAQLKEEMAYQYKIGNFEVKIFSYLSEQKLTLFFPALVVNKYILLILGCGCYPEKVGPRCSHVIWSFEIC